MGDQRKFSRESTVAFVVGLKECVGFLESEKSSGGQSENAYLELCLYFGGDFG